MALPRKSGRQNGDLRALELLADIVSIPLGAHVQQLYVPREDMVKAQYERLKQQGLDPAFPYWARLWPSALAMSAFLEEQPEWVRGKQVLELAAGLGLPSLVAARHAAAVLCTDLSEEAMALAARSAALAGLPNMYCRVLDWNSLGDNLSADLLLLSDVNYEPAAFPVLLQVLQRFLQLGTTILLTTPQRLMAKPFVEALLPHAMHRETREVQDAEGHHFITLLVLQPPGS